MEGKRKRRRGIDRKIGGRGGWKIDEKKRNVRSKIR